MQSQQSTRRAMPKFVKRTTIVMVTESQRRQNLQRRARTPSFQRWDLLSAGPMKITCILPHSSLLYPSPLFLYLSSHNSILFLISSKVIWGRSYCRNRWAPLLQRAWIRIRPVSFTKYTPPVSSSHDISFLKLIEHDISFWKSNNWLLWDILWWQFQSIKSLSTWT